MLVLSTFHEHRFVLFVRPRDPAHEIWDGPRAGVDGAKARFGADHALEIKELAEKLPDFLQDAEQLYYLAGRNRAFDNELFAALESAGRMRSFFTVTREEHPDWQGRRGRISAALLKEALPSPDSICLVCGPPQLVNDTRSLLTELGVSPDRILVEKY